MTFSPQGNNQRGVNLVFWVLGTLVQTCHDWPSGAGTKGGKIQMRNEDIKKYFLKGV